MRAYPRERFSAEVTLTPATVAAHAQAAGDTNPLHHDPEFAATTRYQRVIASGTHTTALLLGLTASHYSQQGAMIGLEFWVRFRRPIYAVTYTYEDDRLAYDEKRFVTLGLVRDIVVSIVHTEANDHIHVISMRKATRREREIYFKSVTN